MVFLLILATCMYVLKTNKIVTFNSFTQHYDDGFVKELLSLNKDLQTKMRRPQQIIKIQIGCTVVLQFVFYT